MRTLKLSLFPTLLFLSCNQGLCMSKALEEEIVKDHQENYSLLPEDSYVRDYCSKNPLTYHCDNLSRLLYKAVEIAKGTAKSKMKYGYNPIFREGWTVTYHTENICSNLSPQKRALEHQKVLEAFCKINPTIESDWKKEEELYSPNGSATGTQSKSIEHE